MIGTAPGPALVGLTGWHRVQASAWMTRLVPVVTGALKGRHRMSGGTDIPEYGAQVRRHGSADGVWERRSGDGRDTWLRGCGGGKHLSSRSLAW